MDRIPNFFLFDDCPSFLEDDRLIIFNYHSFCEIDNIHSKKDIDLLKKKWTLLEFTKFKINNKRFDQKNPTVTFITTTACNMNCRYCSVNANNQKKFLSFDLAKKVLDPLLSKAKTINVIYFWWEPTLTIKLIKQISDYIDSKWVLWSYALSTNWIVSSETIKYLAEKKFVINLSFDWIEKIQNYQRPLHENHTSFNIIDKTLELVIAYNITFKVRATVTNFSVDYMLDFMKYLHDKWVIYVHFEPINICGRTNEDELSRPNLQKFIKNYKKCLDYAEENNMQLVNGLYDNIFSPSFDYCTAATGKKLVITPDWYVTRCYEIQDLNWRYKEFLSWHVNDWINTFIKNTDDVQKILEIARKPCKDCFAKYMCWGWCTIRNFQAVKEWKKHILYRCTLARKLISDYIYRSWKLTFPGNK